MSPSDESDGVTIRVLPTLVHGRYLVRRPRTGTPTGLVLGFHGYAELADHAMASLERLGEGRPWLLVAVQALHPFYRRSGEIVAGWMTSQDRELAIDDNIGYVARVVAEIRREHPGIRRLGCVGFSQGVAMAYRAAAGCGVPTHALVAMAGDVPPELHDGSRSLPPVLIVHGDRDEWYGEPKRERDRELLTRLGVEVETCVFAGGHEWTEESLAAAGAFLAVRLGPNA